MNIAISTYYGDLSAIARTDYRNYKAGAYVSTETELKTRDTTYYMKSNDWLVDLLESYQLDVRSVESISEEEVFYYFGEELEIEEEAVYEVKYLADSKLIVEIQKCE